MDGVYLTLNTEPTVRAFVGRLELRSTDHTTQRQRDHKNEDRQPLTVTASADPARLLPRPRPRPVPITSSKSAPGSSTDTSTTTSPDGTNNPQQPDLPRFVTVSETEHVWSDFPMVDHRRLRQVRQLRVFLGCWTTCCIQQSVSIWLMSQPSVSNWTKPAASPGKRG